MLYTVDLTFHSAERVIQCDHSNESYMYHIKATEQYFPVVLFIISVQGGSNFLFLWMKS